MGFFCYLFVTAAFLYLPASALRRTNPEQTPGLAFLLCASFLVQLLLNAAVMTDQMDTQSRLIMSIAWGIGLAGWMTARRSSRADSSAELK